MNGLFGRNGDYSARELDVARSAVRSAFGSSLAEKATDRFLGAHADVERVGAFLEAMSVSPLPVILEMEARELARESADRIRSQPNWGALLEGIRQIDPAQRIHGSSLLRREQIRRSRDSFLKSAGSIIDTLEHDAEGRAHRWRDAIGSDFLRPLSETCWLNNTIRSRADMRVLAEIAAHEQVSAVDLPRRIELEIDVSTVVIGGPRFRSEHGATGKGVTVAVIDNEVLLDHPALRGRVLHPHNYTSEPWGNPGRHATYIAGIVAGNGLHVGVAPEAEIHNYKIVSSSGSAEDFYGGLALQHSLEDGVDIANCSWGQGSTSATPSRLVQACNNAWDMGLVIIKSAGNDGPLPGTMTSPSEADGIITVGATTRDGTAVADYSSRGPVFPGGRMGPHLVAPGGLPDDPIQSSAPTGEFDWVLPPGTSFAAPHVSGLAALLLNHDPDMSPDGLRNHLVQASSEIVGVGEEAAGAGLVGV